MLRRAEAKTGADPGVLTLIAGGICGVTGYRRSAVFMLDPERLVLEGSAAQGFALEDVAALEENLVDVPLAAASVETRAAVKCEDAQAERCLPAAWIDELGLTAAAVVPLVSGGRPLGLVLLDCADSPHVAWPEAERKAVAFARVAAAALETDPSDEQGARAVADAGGAASVPELEQPRLTDQELNVLRSAADGLTNPEIAARLGLSRHTVKEYLSNAMRKLNAGNRVAAVQKAGNLGLLGGSGTRAPDRGDAGGRTLTYDDGEFPVEASDLKVPPIKMGNVREESEP